MLYQSAHGIDMILMLKRVDGVKAVVHLLQLTGIEVYVLNARGYVIGYILEFYIAIVEPRRKFLGWPIHSRYVIYIRQYRLQFVYHPAILTIKTRR